MSTHMTRRALMGRAPAAAAAGLSALHWARSAGAQPANDKILVGSIGCGGMCETHHKMLFQIPDFEIAALADVDENNLNRKAEQCEKRYGKRPRTFKDFRELLRMKELSVVNIATPDHWHALTFIATCEAGKDIYCEKPISHNIVEGRAMANAAKKHGRVVQIGTQQRSGAHFQKAVEIVRSGLLGRIVETHTWNCQNDKGIGRPPDGDPPGRVDYDFWLGPAPKHAFNPNRFHFNWRWFFDYGGGMVTDWNVHMQDIVHLAMDVWSPKSAVMFGQVANEDDNRDTPDTLKAVYEFDHPRGPFTQTYTLRKTNGYSPDGKPDHASHGALFCGRKANLFVNRGGWELIPEKDSGLQPESGGSSEQNLNHMKNFLACIRSRGVTTSDIESMHKTTAACHLANLSWKIGRKVYWNAQTETCFRDRDLKVADDEANGLLGREYRSPWKLPG